MDKKTREDIQRLLHSCSITGKIVAYEKDEIYQLKRVLRGIEEIKDISNKSELFEKSTRLCNKRIKTIEKNIDELLEEKTKIEEIVEKLEFIKKYIIKERYFKNREWENIVVLYPIQMSLRHFYRLHTEALEELYELFKKNGIMK